MEIRVSVRQLVEFILREGSIDNRKSGSADTAMQEGSRLHRRIQKSAAGEYYAEVGLRHTYKTSKYDIIIEGRADGIIDYDWEKHHSLNRGASNGDENTLPAVQADDKVIIDEIKCTYKELRRITKPVGVHLAQAKCYAFIYADECGLDNIGIRMTYCHIDTEEIKYFHEDYTYDELARWFAELMDEYKKWADFQFDWNEKRTLSIKQLDFPYTYREGQKELASNVYRTIYHRRMLFLEAPTGVGKTISTVFPSVKAMGEGLAEKLFYLTAKTITRTVAQECFGLLSQNGLRLKTVVITARDKICFLKEKAADASAECNPDVCPYAAGHYDRINNAMYDILTNEEHFTRETILGYAAKHNVCPFEMSLDMSLFADAVICDYNYVFDPRVYLKRFFAEGVQRDYIFLIDEAHNLLERGREMYSAALFKEDFLKIRKLLKDTAPRVAKLIDKCNRELLIMKRGCEDYCVEEDIDGFANALVRMYSALDDYLDDHDSFSGRNDVLEFFFEVSHFLNMYEIMDDSYVTYGRLLDDGGFMLKLFNVNPARNLRQCMLRGRSAILFSATLLPIQYYKKLLGGEPDDYEVYAKSTFDEKKRALFIANDVTSKYTRRGRDEFMRIAEYIKRIVSGRCGNYMVFLPSYSFLEQVYECFMENFFDSRTMECIVQEERMSEACREEFLLKFQGNEECDLAAGIDFEIEEDEDGTSLIGFCVMGGIFSEGIDLKRDSLIGAIIVGTGIPQVGCERELLKKHFDAHGGSGFDYAYRFPSMNKVLQSAGRVIRTSEDVGVIALLDERFLEPQYRRLFPREWSGFDIVDADSVADSVKLFWDKTGGINNMEG